MRAQVELGGARGRLWRLAEVGLWSEALIAAKICDVFLSARSE